MIPDRLSDLCAQHAAVRPDAVAVRFEGRTVSWQALHARGEALAGWLWQHAGVRAGDRLAWLGFNHVDQLALLLALARIGGILVPLNFRLAPAEWDAVWRDCTPVGVVHDAAWQEAATALAQRHGAAVWPVDALECAAAGLLPPDHRTAAQAAAAPALLVYTSGTTGVPKGAVHTQGQLLANMAAACAVQSLTAQDTVLTVLPMFHVGGLCIQTLPALAAGATVVLHPRFEPQAMLQAIATDRPTLTLVVPAVMKALIDHPAWASTDTASLRAVWAGSSTLPAALVEAFHARGLSVCNVYGATETGPFSIALGPTHARSHAGSCGWPAPGVEVRRGDTRDGVGELLIRAPNVVRHYWPDRPAVDADGWFHSGDLGAQAADGSWRVVGRSKDMIISGGENIYPAEIENLLAAHPAVADCAVVGLPDARWGEVVVAALVPRAGQALQPEALARYLEPQLARYKLPRRYALLQALPKTALGKVQKAVLQQQLAHPVGEGA